MEKEDELIQLAKKLPIEERKKILMSFKETDLHVHLKQLLGKMDRNCPIEITHGSDEHGNDLVMLRKDVFLESVIGIIVKVGNIKGKTKGKIDEIKSQVEQSLIHPVRLKTIPDRTLLVSEVWVMISGDLSKAAHERLEKEVLTKGRNIRIDFGIDWLVKSFSDFYPQVFFEGKVMDFLAEKIVKLETRAFVFSKRQNSIGVFC